MRLIENRRNLQTVERLVTHHASIHQVRRIDLWIQTLGQLHQLLGFEIVNVKVGRRARSFVIKCHLRFGVGNIDAADIAFR